ncbi:MAG: tetratricopeptide repeat protein [Alphaproteobacteria bacterium]|nr:MAG: tetratricopeptide repeat protein [Alphaproteobacteria bacterium]
MTNADCRDVPVSYPDPAAIRALDRLHEDSLAFQGDPVAGIDEVLREHPDFVLAHCFKAGLLTQTMEVRAYRPMLVSVEAAERLARQANDRERGHIAALRAWVDGNFFGAVQHWEAVLTRHPHDLLALQLVHLTDVLLGDTPGQRDCVARVFPLWSEGLPGHEFVLGFYAFGLEENNHFSHAEELGRRAVAMRPRHPYAIHAVAHVLEMMGRQSGGIWWMRSRADDWTGSNFANHLWWHLALFHLDLMQVDRVLEIHDRHLHSDTPSGDKYEELDAAALLWRLKLLDIDVGARWRDLADKWEPNATDTLYAFNDVHAMMTFVADGRTEAAERLLNANERYVAHAGDANVAMSRIIGLPFCRALQAFGKGDYGRCVDLLLPVRYRTHRLGGSFAQRDIIGWTLLEAALRAGRFALALALANERCALKPTSPQNWRMVARAHAGLGQRDHAERAEARATSLLAA